MVGNCYKRGIRWYIYRFWRGDNHINRRRCTNGNPKGEKMNPFFREIAKRGSEGKVDVPEEN